MTTFQPAAAFAPASLPCPGPIPTSAIHAEHCRLCGKCGALAHLLDSATELTATDLTTAKDSGLARPN